MTKNFSSSTNSILDRMKVASGSQTDAALAKKLNVPRQSISHARKVGKLPDSWLLKFCDIFNTDIDWLKTGLQDGVTPHIAAEIMESMGIPSENIDVAELHQIYSLLGGKLASINTPINPDSLSAIEEASSQMKDSANEFLQTILIKIIHRFGRIKNKLEQKENECDELIAENRRLWRKNSELYEQILTLKNLGQDRSIRET